MSFKSNINKIYKNIVIFLMAIFFVLQGFNSDVKSEDSLNENKTTTEKEVTSNVEKNVDENTLSKDNLLSDDETTLKSNEISNNDETLKSNDVSNNDENLKNAQDANNDVGLNNDATSEITERSANVFEPRAVVDKYDENTQYKKESNGFGITGLNLDHFSFYESKANVPTDIRRGQLVYEDLKTAWYGASMDFNWRIPKEAKEGDYFVLKFLDDTIFFNRAPMYADHEEVPYTNLDSVENRYNNRQDNKLGVITTRGSDKDAPNIPIINIYLVKKNELVFTIQRIKNRKGAMSGQGIIGSPVPKARLTAVTDAYNRYVKQLHSDHNMSQKLKEVITKPGQSVPEIDRLIYFDGITPNRRMFTKENGAYNIGGADQYLWTRGVKAISYFYSKQAPNIPLDTAEFLIPASINFRTEMLSRFEENNVELGKEQIFSRYEDRDHIYYEYIYNANRTQGWVWWPESREDVIAPLIVNESNVYDTKYKTLLIEEYKMYEGLRELNGKSLPNNSPFPYIATKPDGSYQSFGTLTHNDSEVRGAETKIKWDTNKGPEWRRLYNRAKIEHFKFGGDRVIVADIKARKMNPITDKDGNKGYVLRMRSTGKSGVKYQFSFHKITDVWANGSTETEEFSKDTIKIKKYDQNNKPLTSNLKRSDNNVSFVFKDSMGNIYTESGSTDGLYNDASGFSLKQREEGGRHLFKDSFGNIFKRQRIGSTYLFEGNGSTYYTHPNYDGQNHTYISDNGDVFYPTRPLVYIDGIDLKIELKGKEHIVSDRLGNKFEKINIQSDNEFQIYGRHGYSIRVEYVNGQYNFYKWSKIDPNPAVNDGKWIPLTKTMQGEFYHVSGLDFDVLLEPEFTNEKTAKFWLHDKTADRNEYVSVDEYGYLTLGNLLRGHSYEFKEVDSKEGYEIFQEKYTIDIDDQGIATFKKPNGDVVTERDYPIRLQSKPYNIYSIYNKPKSKIIIEKVNSSKALINTSKAVFELYKADEVNISGHNVTPKSNGIKPIVIETEKVDGGQKTIGSSELKYVDPSVTDWILIEKTAPNNYIKLSQPIKLTLSKDSSGAYKWQLKETNSYASIESDGITIKVTNIPKNVIKFSKVNLLGNRLGDMKLKIQAKNHDSAPVFKDEKEKNNFSGEVITNEKAITWKTKTNQDVSLSLENGKYTISELETNNGYVKFEPFDIQVNDKNITVVNSNGVSTDNYATIEKPNNSDPIVKIKNYKGQIKIHVHEKNRPRFHIQNSSFKLLKWDGVVPRDNSASNDLEIQSQNSNRNGIVKFEGIEPGFYKLLQHSVPSKYKLNSTKFLIKVRSDYSVEISNPGSDSAIEAKAAGVENETRIANIEFRNELKKYNIKLLKKDYKDDNIGLEAQFTLKIKKQNKFNNVSSGTTNTNDKSHTFSNLLPGDYQLTETRAPSGYQTLEPITFKLNENGSVTNIVSENGLVSVDNSKTDPIEMTVKNVKQYKIKVVNHDFDDNKRLQNGRFELYTLKGNTSEKVGPPQTWTDVYQSGTDINNISKGRYLLKQLSIDDKYELNTKEYVIKVDTFGRVTNENGDSLFSSQNANENNEIILTIKNKLKVYDVKIHKKDFDTNAGLNAEFKLHDALTDTEIVGKQGSTNANQNTLLLRALKPGSYALKETRAPNGNYIALKPIIFTVNLDGTVTLDTKTDQTLVQKQDAGSDKVINLTVKNVRKFKLKVNTKDLQKDNFITGATYTLYNVVDARKGAEVSSQTVKALDGVIFDDIEYGKYIIVEKTPPNNYQANPKEYNLTVNTDGSIIADNSDDKITTTAKDSNRVMTVTLKNQKQPANLIISKRIKGIETNSTITDEVEFSLRKDGSNEALKVIKKPANQDIVFENLEEGDYTLTESKVPNGFVKEKDKVYKVKVDSYGNVSMYAQPLNSTHSQSSETLTKDNLIKSDNLGNNSNQFAQNSTEELIFDNDIESSVKYRKFVDDKDDIPVDTYIGLDLKDIKHIKKFTFRQGQTDNKLDRFNHFKFQYSLDNTKWFDLEEFNEADDNNQNSAFVTLEKNYDVFARYIRVINLRHVTKKWFAVRQLAIETVKDDVVVNTKDQDKYLFGNIEVPSLMIEKLDKDTNEVIKGNNVENQEYNAKFALYKVDDQLENLDHLNFETMGVSEIAQEFILKEGKLESEATLNLKEYGRYVLVEIDSPYNYQKIKPILLDLVLTKRKRVEGEAISVVWKTVKEAKLEGNSEDKYTGSATLDDLIIDYSKLESENVITFKVKNQKKVANITISKRIKGIETNSSITDEVEFTLTKDNDPNAQPIVFKQNGTKDFIFENLKEGDYTLIESKVPSGFVREKDKEYKVRVDKNANVILYSKPNGLNDEGVKENLSIENGNLIKSEYLGKQASQLAENSQESAIFDEDIESSVNYKDFLENGVNNIPQGTYIGVDLKEVKRVKKFTYRQGKIRNATDRFNHFKIQYSLDGKNYLDIREYHENDPDRNGSEVETIEQNLDIFARYIRVINLKEVTRRWFAVRQLAVEVFKDNEVVKTKEDDKYLFGNIEVPSLMIEKYDKETKELITANNVESKDYNAKFALYKVDDQLDSLESINFEDMRQAKLVSEFTLKQGKLESDAILNLTDYGKYALVELESPFDYNKIKPILLDLVLSERTIKDKGKAISVTWKVVEKDGVTENSNLEIDDSKLKEENTINFKVYNELSSKRIILKLKLVDRYDQEITGTDLEKVTFTIKDSKDQAIESKPVDNNVFVFDNNKKKYNTGLYYIYQDQAPKGYNKVAERIPIFVTKKGEVIAPTVLKDKEYIKDLGKLSKFVKVADQEEEGVVTIKIKNFKSEFPETGGHGTLTYSVGGLLMMLVSYIGLKRKKREIQ